jgi:hypothetical protein
MISVVSGIEYRYQGRIQDLWLRGAMPIDGRARVLGMEFGVGNLLLRYDFFLFCVNKQTNRISF